MTVIVLLILVAAIAAAAATRPHAPDDILRRQATERFIRVDTPLPAAVEVVGRYIVTLGLYEFWRRVTFFGLSDQRIVGRKGLFVIKTEKSLPLRSVQDASISQFLWWSYVTVSTAGAGSSGLEKLGPMSIAAAHTFKDELLAAAQGKIPPPMSPEPEPPVRPVAPSGVTGLSPYGR